MVKLSFSNEKVVIFFLTIFAGFSLFLNVFNQSSIPPGFNADEAAFGYNAYSILKTGKDEYGNFLPLRLKSFGDYKMPLYSYLSIPFVAVFGLNEGSTRALNNLISLLFPIIIYFLAREIFERKDVALLSSFFVTLSLGLHSIGREAHEAYLASFLISLSMLFLIKSFKYWKRTDIIISSLFSLLSLFAYQSSRIFGIFFLLFSIYYVFRNKGKKFLILALFISVVLFSLTDVLYKPERVKNLLLTNNLGFSLQINELRAEGGSRFLYNKLFVGARDAVFQHIGYYSPQFLAINGDENLRFGFPKMSPMTIVEYAFSLIGLFFLFKNRERWRYFLGCIILIAPLSASLSWAGASLSRSLFILIPLLIISSYGLIELLKTLNKKEAYIFLSIVVLAQIFFQFYSWDFYFNHYSKRAVVQIDWQAGSRKLGEYLANNYNKFNKFYITKKDGQPYIFTLFYLKFDPSKYQKMARLSSPDQYGFGQVDGFDKFDFNFVYNPDETNVSLIGYPDDFSGLSVDSSKLRKIITGNQEVFWIYER